MVHYGLRETVLKSITIHGMDDELAAAIEKEAHKDQLSLNKTIKKLLARSLGIKAGRADARKNLFHDLCGVWTAEEAHAFQNSSET